MHGVGAVPLAARLRGLDRGEPERPQLAVCDVAQHDVLVHERPLALRAPRCPALRIAMFVDRPDHAVDPAVLEGDLDGLGPRDRRLAARLLPVYDPDLGLDLVVRVEPRCPLGRVTRGDLAHVKAFSPVSARPMSSFWIWLVPSYNVVTRASRRYLPPG